MRRTLSRARRRDRRRLNTRKVGWYLLRPRSHAKFPTGSVGSRPKSLRAHAYLASIF